MSSPPPPPPPHVTPPTPPPPPPPPPRTSSLQSQPPPPPPPPRSSSLPQPPQPPPRTRKLKAFTEASSRQIGIGDVECVEQDQPQEPPPLDASIADAQPSVPPVPPIETTASSSSSSSSSSRCSQTYLPEGTTRKPVLIVPGFMSSALRVEKSSIVPRWQGKRIWMSLGRLGFTGKVLGTSHVFETNDDETEQVSMRNDWLLHLTLQTDLLSEREGIEVRPIPGLSGVDFLEPGLFLSAQTYVFGPVIKALVSRGGYTCEKDLDAVPYDWRLPPTILEERDAYFSKTLDRIETMVRDNDGARIVLLCHSMGCQVGEYLLRFALDKRGQAWIDAHVDTYLPIGAPHLGAASSLASIVRGSNMGLPTSFLSPHAALIMGRSLGSTPLLLPVGSNGRLETEVALSTRAFCPIVKHTGMLRIKLMQLDLRQLATFYRNLGRMRLRIKLASTKLATAWYQADPQLLVEPSDGENAYVMFEMEAPVDLGQGDDRLTLEIQEQVLAPDVAARRLYTSGRRAARGVAEKTGLAKVGARLYDKTIGAVKTVDPGHVICKADFMLGHILTPQYVSGTTVLMTFPLAPATSSSSRLGCTAQVTMEIAWFSPQFIHSQNAAQLPTCPAPVTSSPASRSHLNPESSTYFCYTPIDMLRIEGLHDTVRLWESHFFQRDPYIATSAPPVDNVYAIYGVNVNTMTSCIFRRQAKQVRSSKLANDFQVDTSATLDSEFAKTHGLKLSKGVIYETSATPQPDGKRRAGDGVVPYQSLAHVSSWAATGSCKVCTKEIPGAEHRAILNNPDLHAALLDFLVTLPPEPLPDAIPCVEAVPLS